MIWFHCCFYIQHVSYSCYVCSWCCLWHHHLETLPCRKSWWPGFKCWRNACPRRPRKHGAGGWQRNAWERTRTWTWATRASRASRVSATSFQRHTEGGEWTRLPVTCLHINVNVYIYDIMQSYIYIYISYINHFNHIYHVDHVYVQGSRVFLLCWSPGPGNMTAMSMSFLSSWRIGRQSSTWRRKRSEKLRILLTLGYLWVEGFTPFKITTWAHFWSYPGIYGKKTLVFGWLLEDKTTSKDPSTLPDNLGVGLPNGVPQPEVLGDKACTRCECANVDVQVTSMVYKSKIKYLCVYIYIDSHPESCSYFIGISQPPCTNCIGFLPHSAASLCRSLSATWTPWIPRLAAFPKWWRMWMTRSIQPLLRANSFSFRNKFDTNWVWSCVHGYCHI